MCQKQNGAGFQAPKKAVRIILKLNYRESCRASFGELGLMTLPCLYVFEVIVYCRSRCALISGRDVHQYETRGRDNLRTHQRRLALSQHLPQQVGVRLINKLPEDIKNSNNLNQFKTRLDAWVTTRRAVTTDVTPSPRGTAWCPLLVHYTLQNTVGVTTRRAVTTDVTPSPRGTARCPLLVHYTLQNTVGVTTRRAVTTDVTPSPRGTARWVTTRRAVTTDVTPSPRGTAQCPLLVHYTLQNTVGVTTRRAVTTDVTPSPRGTAWCPLLVHYTLQNTVGVTTRRAVTTDVTPSPHVSARCPLLVHYTLQHGKGRD
ncbi:hypothetical protein J6590_069177 [Homalodisca vitripennis]|nr:hypothetical protein J6590_069177 [Homalodisca vitripennis]